MNLPNVLPCKCTNPICGITFMSRNLVGVGGSNFVFRGNKTHCPKCGQTAYYADWSTDSAGQFYLSGFFSELRTFRDVEKLKELKSELEAANETVTAQELADVLIEIDPGFQKFKQAIASIPVGKIATVIQTLVGIITLLVLLNQWRSDEKFKEEQLNLQKDQFEYQKEMDKKSDSEKSESEKEIENIQKQIDTLQQQLQENLEKNNQGRNGSTPGPGLKGNCRNKPCPCGSGKKAKKCHPNGYMV
jgi:hypothetical protein